MPVIDIEAILTTVATVVVIGATFIISGPILGAVYVVGGFALSEGINCLADTYIGPGWGNIINGTLGFLALGLGAMFSRRAALAERASLTEGGRVNYPGFGGDIITRPNKTTTVIGKFNDEVNGAGTKEILNMPEGSFTRGGENKNGVNILDIPSKKYQALLDEYGEVRGKEIFWEEYNKPFLEEAFSRGDDVRVLSDPQAPKNRTGFYERELREIEGYTDANGNRVPGLAERYGYEYDPVTNTYRKK